MKNNRNISRKDRLKSKRLAPANYLIVCEGKQTEPNYFNGLKKKINEKYGSKVDVLIPNIEIKGTGENTTALVKYTDKFVNYSNIIHHKTQQSRSHLYCSHLLEHAKQIFHFQKYLISQRYLFVTKLNIEKLICELM